MQEPHPPTPYYDHTPPTIQFPNQPHIQQMQPHVQQIQPNVQQMQPHVQQMQPHIQQIQPHMMVCPMQYVYDPQMLVSPNEQVQPSPTQTFQNQTYLVPNTPPWIQNRTNMVYMPQMQITNNMQPYVSQNMVQNPMFNYQYQPIIMQQEIRHMVPNFVNQNLVNQQMVQNLIHPQTVVQNPQTMVQNSQPIVQNPPSLTQNPQIITQDPEAMTQNPQTITQNPQTMTQNPQVMTQNPQAMTQNPQAMTQNPQVMIQNPQVLVQNSQVMVRNPQNVISQNIIQNPVSFQMEQNKESPLLIQMLQNNERQPAPSQNEKIALIQAIRPQYKNVRPHMIILNPIVNHTCVQHKETPVSQFITNETPQPQINEIPQHIINQIPEGLSVKTIYKVPATALVKPTEYTLKNIAPADDAHPREYPKPVVKPPSNRDPQVNYKRKIKELKEQNAKDENEVQVIKRNRQGAANAKTKVRYFINTPTTIVDPQNNEGTGLVNNRLAQNTQIGSDRPQKKEKLLRNTVYVQARGRVDESLKNDVPNVNANHTKENVILDPNNAETNSSAQVFETNRVQENDEAITVTENSQSEVIQEIILPHIALSHDSSETMNNNTKSLPSNDTIVVSDKNCSKVSLILKSNDDKGTETRNNSKMALSSLSNDTDKTRNNSNKPQTLPSTAVSSKVSKKPKVVKKIKKAEIQKMVETANDNKDNFEKYVLTHVLDGHIIQESNFPFLVQKPTLSLKKQNPYRIEDTAPSIDDKETESSINEQSSSEETDISLDKEETEISTGNHEETGDAEREKVADSELDENETSKVGNDDDPFDHLSRSTVKSWTVSDVTSYLKHHKTWRVSAQKLFDQEIDGESLLLVNKEQLLQIGLSEKHAEVLGDFLEKVQ